MHPKRVVYLFVGRYSGQERLNIYVVCPRIRYLSFEGGVIGVIYEPTLPTNTKPLKVRDSYHK